MQLYPERAERRETEFDPMDVMYEVGSDYAKLGLSLCMSSAPAARRVTVSSDRERLEALLCSLLGNASDHSQPGTPITLTFLRQEASCAIVVSNRIACVPRTSGLGLGSHISAQLAKEAGAKLRVDRDWETYSVTIQLPIVMPTAGYRFK
jgi:C4-dicarboxylate-specific signal transduction histidine kinase